MPLYSVTCDHCGAEDTLFRRIADRDCLPKCAACRGPLRRRLGAPAVRAEITPFISPASGRPITSRAAMRDDLARTGHIEWEPGIKEHIDKRKAALVEQNLAAMDKTVDRIVTDLHVSGKV